MDYQIIKQLREKKGLTQSALARKAGISQSILSDIENGNVNPTIATLIKISNALEINITQLLDSA